MTALIELFVWGDRGWGDEMVVGLTVTARLALFAYALGLAIGLLGAAAKLSKVPVLRTVAEVYTTVFRALPELVIISLIYFGGSIMLRMVLTPFGHTGYIEVNAFASGIVALGLVSGAYGTEVLRGAVLAVPQGQSDAAMAVGLSRARVFLLVVLPQAWRIALPGLGNLWMTMLKETALVSVIGLQDLVREAGLAAASTRQPFPFFTAVALGYLALTAVSMVAIVRLERHVHRGYEPTRAG